jgi:hypothetical protein
MFVSAVFASEVAEAVLDAVDLSREEGVPIGVIVAGRVAFATTRFDIDEALLIVLPPIPVDQKGRMRLAA